MGVNADGKPHGNGRRLLFDEKIPRRNLRLTKEQLVFLVKVSKQSRSGQGHSHGLRVVLSSYKAAVDGGAVVELVDRKQNKKKALPRTSFALPDYHFYIGSEAAGGRGATGIRMIVMAAMDGKFAVDYDANFV